MARWARDAGVILRFIEYMDVGDTNGWRLDEVVPAAEIVAAIDAELPLEPLRAGYRGEVAERWRYRDGGARSGSSPRSRQPFCGDCTRARLSAEGKLYTCLFSAVGHDLRALLRSGGVRCRAGGADPAIWAGPRRPLLRATRRGDRAPAADRDVRPRRLTGPASTRGRAPDSQHRSAFCRRPSTPRRRCDPIRSNHLQCGSSLTVRRRNTPRGDGVFSPRNVLAPARFGTERGPRSSGAGCPEPAPRDGFRCCGRAIPRVDRGHVGPGRHPHPSPVIHVPVHAPSTTVETRGYSDAPAPKFVDKPLTLPAPAVPWSCPKGPSGTEEPRSHQGPPSQDRSLRALLLPATRRRSVPSRGRSPGGTRPASRCRYSVGLHEARGPRPSSPWTRSWRPARS